MSTHQTNTRRSIAQLQAMKQESVPIVCLTAYTAPHARILDAHCDMFIVGDSLGMVLYGHDSTLEVTLDMMKHHGKAVTSHSQHAFTVVDMPFGSYQTSKEQAFENAAEIMRFTGCQAVKMEGGVMLDDTVRFVTQRGIPVMGHIGLMPQYAHNEGGFRYRGRSEAEQNQILRDAKAIEQAGAFAMILEAVDASLAERITKSVSIPVIGIGASAQCDGQVLVTEDMAGLTENTPKFVATFGNLASTLDSAASAYAKSVRERTFPGESQLYGMSKKVKAS